MMKSLQSVRPMLLGVASCGLYLVWTQGAHANVAILEFKGGKSGSAPPAGLVVDANGNLFGTTIQGGKKSTGCSNDPCGLVFELSPPAAGKGAWTETVLHDFAGGDDGASPYAPLIFDGHGNLYGTTAGGGVSTYGSGTAFMLSPPSAGKTAWKESVIYSFNGTTSGGTPLAGLLLDKAGNLYGTTANNTSGNYGTVFELIPPGGNSAVWTENVLYTFSPGADGYDPEAGLVMDSSGNLFGTVVDGGASNNGAVFELSPPANGSASWKETVLHSFNLNDSDGGYPYAPLIADKDGNLYGTTKSGGLRGYGTVYEMSPPSGGKGPWTEAVLYSFVAGRDGSNPLGAVTMDSKGALYGTTSTGGTVSEIGAGTVFKLTPPTDGSSNWTESQIYIFTPAQIEPNGAKPESNLVSGLAGKLYGTTLEGGKNAATCDYGCGVVFGVKP